MTPKEKEIYKKILKYREKHGYSPQPSVLTKKKVSRQSVEKHIKNMIEKGVLTPIEPIKQGWYKPVDNTVA